MTVFFKKIEDFSHGTVQFYTVELGKNELTEFELFVEKDFPDHEKELEILYNIIDLIQERGQAKQSYFKSEANANALPIVPKWLMDANKIDFGLRLYCIMLTEHLVILLNGGIKTNINPRMCDNVKNHFSYALRIATKLDALRLNDDIDFLEDDCLTDLEIDI